MEYDDVEIYADGREQQDGQAGGGEDEEQKPKPKRRRAAPRKRPKLTLEDLQKPSGLQLVFQNIPKWFQEGYRGKGHEVRNLRRLLELYQRWQPKVFPHGTYNQFEAALEKMSGTHALKDTLAKMRQDLINIVDPPSAHQDQDQQQQDQQQGADLPPQQQQQPEEPAGHDGEGFGDFDDDELLALQAQDAAMDAAEEVVPEAFEDFGEHEPTGPAAHPVHTRVGSNMSTAKRTMRDWSDDDDDDDDGPVGFSRQQQQRTASPTAASAGNRAASPSPTAADDAQQRLYDDLLDDMLQDEDLLLQDAAAAPGAAADADNQHDLGTNSGVHCDDEYNGIGDAGSRKAKHSRLQRAAAVQDSDEDEDMADAQPAAGSGEAVQNQGHEQHIIDEEGQKAASHAAAAAAAGSQRQWQLADDDSDSNDGGALAPAAAADGLQQPTAGLNKQAAGTQAANVDDDDDLQFAPLTAFNTQSVTDFGTAAEMELVLGTDLQGLQQHQQQQ